MEVVIFVRQKIDWDKLSRKEFYAQDSSSTVWKLLNSGVPLLEFWDDIFDVPFLKFRSKIKEIAEYQNSLTNCRIIRGQEELEEELSSPQDAYILPVDDDDFFSSNIQKLINIKDPNGIILWPEGCLYGSELVRARPKSSHPLRGIATNAYAIRKSMLNDKIDRGKWWHILRYHGFASRIICPDCNMKEFLDQVTYLEEPLSVSNRHIGTITLWQSIICGKPNANFKIEILKRYYDYTSKSIQEPNEYSWCYESAIKNLKMHHDLFSSKTLKHMMPPLSWTGAYPWY